MNPSLITAPPLRAGKESFPPPARRYEQAPSILTFSPMAWLKLRLFLHADEVEVAGFGISAEQDLLYIEDFRSVKQRVTAVTVELDDIAVADHIDLFADSGIAPNRCARVWIHTHPGTSPEPSAVDEQTFARVFGTCDWAVMAIVARGGASYARLRFNAGPGGHTLIPIRVDWERFPQELADREDQLDRQFSDWMDEYGRNVHRATVKCPARCLLSDFSPAAYPDRWQQFDGLYDDQILQEEEYGVEIDSWSEGREVYP